MIGDSSSTTVIASERRFSNHCRHRSACTWSMGSSDNLCMTCMVQWGGGLGHVGPAHMFSICIPAAVEDPAAKQEAARRFPLQHSCVSRLSKEAPQRVSHAADGTAKLCHRMKMLPS